MLHTFLGKTHPLLGNFVKPAGNNRRALNDRLQIAGALLKGFSRGLATEAEHPTLQHHLQTAETLAKQK
jgi:hypothetical protein